MRQNYTRTKLKLKDQFVILIKLINKLKFTKSHIEQPVTLPKLLTMKEIRISLCLEAVLASFSLEWANSACVIRTKISTLMLLSTLKNKVNRRSVYENKFRK